MADLTKVNLDNLWASTGSTVSPSNQKVNTGWVAGEIPPAEHQNWWQNRVDRILSYLYQKGIPEWSSTQEYIANKSVVIEGGKIWMCKSTHTNKRPSTDTPRTYWREPAINLNDIPNASSSVYGVVRVSNSLTNTSTTDALSAAQGKSLQDNKMNKSSNLSDITSVSAARNNLGLGTAATSNVTTSTTDTSSDRVLKVGDFGIGNIIRMSGVSQNDLDDLYKPGFYYVPKSGNNLSLNSTVVPLPQSDSTNYSVQMAVAQSSSSSSGASLRLRSANGSGVWNNWAEVVHSGNIAQTTGNNTTVPMSQKAVSDVLGTAIGGLGTAASHNVTTSTTDTGSNRVLRYRDFGVGSALEFSNVEGNNYTGLFSVGSSSASFGGKSFPGWTMYLNMTRNSSGHGAMLAINTDSMWFARRNTDGTGNQSYPVHEVAHSGNISSILSSTNALQAAYPVGSIYMNAKSNTNPASLLGFGTWQQYAAGRVLLGRGSGGGGTYNTREAEGGSKDAIVVSHNHSASSSNYNLSHTHSVSVSSTNLNHTHTGTTNGNNRGHTHSGTTSLDGAHAHSYRTASSTGGSIDSGGGWGKTDSTTSVAPHHQHTFTTGGESQNHTHSFTTGGALGNHSHTVSLGSWGGNHNHSITVNSTGSSGTNANMMPYIVVSIWVRTA